MRFNPVIFFAPTLAVAILCIALGYMLGRSRKSRDDSRRHIADRLKPGNGRNSNISAFHRPQR